MNLLKRIYYLIIEFLFHPFVTSYVTIHPGGRLEIVCIKEIKEIKNV